MPAHILLIRTQVRNRALLSFFVVGLCVGLMVAERVYLSRGGAVPKPRILQTEYDRQQRHHHLGAGSAAGGARVLTAGDRLGAAARAVDPAAILPLPEDQPPRDDLEAQLRVVAPSHEVLVAVANKNTWQGDGMLLTFLNGVRNAGVKNHLVVAIDHETKDWCDKNGFHAWYLDLQVHKVRCVRWVVRARGGCAEGLPATKRTLRWVARWRAHAGAAGHGRQPRRVGHEVRHPQALCGAGLGRAALGRRHCHPAGARGWVVGCGAGQRSGQCGERRALRGVVSFCWLVRTLVGQCRR